MSLKFSALSSVKFCAWLTIFEGRPLSFDLRFVPRSTGNIILENTCFSPPQAKKIGILSCLFASEKLLNDKEFVGNLIKFRFNFVGNLYFC